MNTIKTIEQMLASLAGYRREMNDGQPCVAEKAGLALLEELKVQEPVALETVYETIIHWDKGGGKRSRRELARRIVALYTHQQPKAEPIDLEPPLEALVNLCNNSSLYCNADEVIAAEAALERLYQSRATLPAAQTAQPKAEQSNEQRLLETFWRVVQYLGIEDEFLKNPKGKPSDVFIEAIKKRDPQPKREPLTDEQIEACLHHVDEDGIGLFAFARAIEAAHGIIKNYPEKDKT